MEGKTNTVALKPLSHIIKVSNQYLSAYTVHLSLHFPAGRFCVIWVKLLNFQIFSIGLSNGPILAILGL